MFEEPRPYFTAFWGGNVSAVITEYNSFKTFLVSSLPETWLSGVYVSGESFLAGVRLDFSSSRSDTN